MIDIGANLANPVFADDLTQVLARAKGADIESIIVTGTSVDGSEQAIALAKQHPDLLRATAGVHPHDADSFDADAERQILQLLEQTCVVAVGETGLDYNRNFSTPENQRHSFEAHIDMARQCGKPLFLHERDAFEDFYRILAASRGSFGNAIVHCFTGSQEALRAYLDLGLYIGITGWICDKKRGQSLRDIIAYAPLDRLMIETDAPYLTPHDKAIKSALVKSNRNEPWTLSATANRLAECLSIDTATLRSATTENARRFFAIDD